MGGFFRDLFEAAVTTILFVSLVSIALMMTTFIFVSNTGFSFVWFACLLIAIASVTLIIWLLIGTIYGKNQLQKMRRQFLGKWNRNNMSPSDLLEEQYYRGEITKDEYEQLKEGRTRGNTSIISK